MAFVSLLSIAMGVALAHLAARDGRDRAHVQLGGGILMVAGVALLGAMLPISY
jgi:hypothetical protein